MNISQLLDTFGIDLNTSLDIDVNELLSNNLNSDCITEFITSNAGLKLTYLSNKIVVNAFGELINSIAVSNNSINAILKLNFQTETDEQCFVNLCH